MILHPRPSPIAASMYQLRDIGIDAIILHGPSGCCFRTARLLEIDGIRVFTSSMSENDFIFGAMDKLRNVINEVLEYLKKECPKKEPYKIGVVGTCASMIIGEDLKSAVEEFEDIIIPVEIHSGLNDNTIGAVRAMEGALLSGLITNREYERQKKMLLKATEIEKARGMAKNKYLKPNYDDDLEKFIEILKNAKKEIKNGKNLKLACILNAKKETAYLFSNPLLELNKHFNCINIANLDENIGFDKIRKDAKNIVKEFNENGFKIDYITGGLDEYPIACENALSYLIELNPDIVIVSGVPHALLIEKLKDMNPNVITVGISDGPRLYHPIKEVYDFCIIELDAHAKVLGNEKIVKSRLGEILSYLNF
ncbi:vanadium nitrogenase-associated related protein N [Methanococcus vannielii SB]|uniref:Vanadium nitrogenase-associated related protein N n=1 Tax=Methanococcus vannielii (strain ATCC 35089 / DSM 1224 / JCM 13029 / OCM 148 / SB) TaxID=406327 RepID=A6US37_METVS|nr:Ni-sirohydrochlorin a,c-diamide reductive cyclase catalytic subunit [Methanococcus vannielii]ABR55309.1 vanadium nitrogenase-associated related protein N [Methanococcus vannielii SB]